MSVWLGVIGRRCLLGIVPVVVLCGSCADGQGGAEYRSSSSESSLPKPSEPPLSVSPKSAVPSAVDQPSMPTDYVTAFERLRGKATGLGGVHAPPGVIGFAEASKARTGERCARFAVVFSLAAKDARHPGDDTGELGSLIAPGAPPGLAAYLRQERDSQRLSGTGRHFDSAAELWGRMAIRSVDEEAYELVGRAAAPGLGLKAWVIMRIDTIRVSGKCYVKSFASRVSPENPASARLAAGDLVRVLPGSGWARISWE